MGIRDYHEAISRAPRHAEFYYKRGVAWSALKQYAYAIEDYSKCLELNADYADALNNRGNAYRILNQYTLAKTDLKRAVQLAPSSDLYANNLKRVEAALQEEEKTGKSAQQTAIESILQSVLSAKLQGNHAQPILPGMSAQLESMLKSFIALKQSPSHAVPVVAPPSHSATSAFSPPPSRSSSPAPPSPSSSSSSTSSSSSPSLSSVVQSLPAPLLNTLLQLFVEYRAAQKGEGRGQKRTRDEGEGKIKVGTIKVYGEELYDEGEDEEHSPSSAASEGSRSPESGGGRGEVTEGLDISEMERCRKAIAV
jgi:tetratricopeptide (TPR) repeat protein